MEKVYRKNMEYVDQILKLIYDIQIWTSEFNLCVVLLISYVVVILEKGLERLELTLLLIIRLAITV